MYIFNLIDHRIDDVDGRSTASFAMLDDGTVRIIVGDDDVYHEARLYFKDLARIMRLLDFEYPHEETRTDPISK